MAERPTNTPPKRKQKRQSQPQTPAHRPRSHAVTLRKATVTIEFANEGELRNHLAALLEMLDRPANAAAAMAPERSTAAAAAAVESCLTLFDAVDVVAEALEPKDFVPSEKLGTTYLTPQERESFQARVVERVEARRCRIDASDVPSDEGTLHSAVAGAVRDRARR
jgi:hypothetical protein